VLPLRRNRRGIARQVLAEGFNEGGENQGKNGENPGKNWRKWEKTGVREKKMKT